MNSIIKEIINIDKKAKDIIEKVEIKEKNLDEYIEEKIDLEKQKIENEKENLLSEKKKEYNSKLKIYKQKTDLMLNMELEKLQETYEANKGKNLEKAYNNIIKSGDFFAR